MQARPSAGMPFLEMKTPQKRSESLHANSPQTCPLAMCTAIRAVFQHRPTNRRDGGEESRSEELSAEEEENGTRGEFREDIEEEADDRPVAAAYGPVQGMGEGPDFTRINTANIRPTCRTKDTSRKCMSWHCAMPAKNEGVVAPMQAVGWTRK